MRFLLLVILPCLLLAMGCSKKSGMNAMAPEDRDEKKAEKKEEKKEERKEVKDADADEKGRPAVHQERKIKYSGVIEVIVEDFADSVETLAKLVATNKGYIAQSEVKNSPGQPRSGHWKLRIPVARFQTIREAIAKLGETEKNTTDSEDVTTEYYDLVAHIKNKKEEEAALQKLFQASAGKLEDILKVRDALSSVRTDIDQHQGRLNALKLLTDMTTLDVYLHDRHTYVPPDAATYGTTIERTFFGSIDGLVAFGKQVFLIAVAVVPWLPVIGVIAVPLWLLHRRNRRFHVRPPRAALGGEPAPPRPV